MIMLLIGPNCLNEVSFKTNQPTNNKGKNKEGKMGFTSLIPFLGPGFLYGYFAESKSIEVIELFPYSFVWWKDQEGVMGERTSWNDLPTRCYGPLIPSGTVVGKTSSKWQLILP